MEMKPLPTCFLDSLPSPVACQPSRKIPLSLHYWQYKLMLYSSLPKNRVIVWSIKNPQLRAYLSFIMRDLEGALWPTGACSQSEPPQTHTSALSQPFSQHPPLFLLSSTSSTLSLLPSPPPPEACSTYATQGAEPLSLSAETLPPFISQLQGWAWTNWLCPACVCVCVCVCVCGTPGPWEQWV